MSWKDAPLAPTSSWRDAPLAETPNLRETVATAIQPEGLDIEQAEQVKLHSYLEQKGYGVDTNSIDSYKKSLFGDKPYSAINKELASQLDVQPLGPITKSAKTRKQDVNALIYANATKSPFEVPAIIAERDSRLAIDDASQGMAPLRGFADAYVSGLGGSIGNVMDSYGGMLMLVGDAVGSSAISNEGRGISSASQKFRMAGETKEAWEKFIGSDNLFRDTKKYQIFEGLGRIGGYASMGGAAPAAIWSDLHNGVRESIAGYTNEETASKYSWPISISLGMISSKSINDILKQTPLAASTTPKAFVGQVMRRFANKVPASLFEAGTEVSEDLVPDVAFGGKDAVQKNISQYIDSFALSIILTGIVGAGAGIKADTDQTTAFNAYKDHLTNKGFSEDSASRIAEEVVAGIGKTEGDALKQDAKIEAVIQEEVKNEANKQARIQALEDFESAVNDGSKDVDTEQTVVGFNGQGITTDDVSTLREQPEFLESLDDSEASNLLKEIVVENRLEKIPEYNQMVAGVEEQVAPTAEDEPAEPTAESTQAEEQTVPVEEKTDEQILTELQIQQPQDAEQFAKETEPERNGIPRVIGNSRKANDMLSDVIGMMNVSKANHVAWTETLQNAFNMGLHERSSDIVLKVFDGKQINSDEVAGLLIKKSMLANKMEYVDNAMQQAKASDDMSRVAELQLEYDALMSETLQISEAARKGTTENARALAAMAMWMDRKTFTLENVLAQHRKGFGENPDSETSAWYKEKVDEIASLEKQLESGEFEEKKPATQKKVDEVTQALKDRKAELERQIELQKEREAIIQEVETATRRIKEKKIRNEDVNADVKLIRKRQDKIFGIIDEINRGKAKKDQIKKESNPDSEGYINMIEALKPELQQKRTERKLQDDIKNMEDALSSGDLSEYMKSPKEYKDEPRHIRELRARKLALQKEITRRLNKRNTLSDVLMMVYDTARTAKLTGDFGHLWRQGGIMITDPKMYKEGHINTLLAETFKSFSELKANEAEDMIMQLPNYYLAIDAGLRSPQEGEQLTEREYILGKSLLNHVPALGKVSEAFGRSQLVGTKIIRHMMFESIVADYGPDITLEEAKDIAYAVNILTGYGEYKGGGGLEKIANTIFISPRFRASRVQAPFLLLLSRDGRRIWDNKVLRNRIAKSQAWYASTRLLFMAMAGWAGYELFDDDIKFITDPNSWARGRLAVRTESGDWRVYNPWSGHTSVVNYIANASNPDIGPIKAGLRFAESMAHPALSMVAQMMSEKDYSGKRIHWYEALLRGHIPIGAEGVWESTKKETGTADLVLSTVADLVGIDNQLVDKNELFKRKAPEKKKRIIYEGLMD